MKGLCNSNPNLHDNLKVTAHMRFEPHRKSYEAIHNIGGDC